MKIVIVVVLLFIYSNSSFAFESVIEKGDVLKVLVYGNPDLTIEDKVSAKGEINIPLIGSIKVSGMSPYDAEQKIVYKFVHEGFLKKAQVNIIVVLSRGRQVSVLGQVVNPGKYTIEPGTKTLFDFIAISGGVSAKGSDLITVIRTAENPPKRFSFNVSDLLLGLSTEKISIANMDMQAGDVVYIPEAPVFYVYGEVNRPGVYRLKRGMTVIKAMSSAGGLSAKGTDRNLEIIRKHQEMEVNLLDPVLAGDVIIVKESLF